MRPGRCLVDTTYLHAASGRSTEVNVTMPTGGKNRLGRITKAGNRQIRRLLVLGATSMVYRAPQWNSAAGAWTRGILARRPVRLVTVALANKMARIAWALMTREEVYRARGRIVAATEAAA